MRNIFMRSSLIIKAKRFETKATRAGVLMGIFNVLIKDMFARKLLHTQSTVIFKM